jgi:hypothetical protein
MNQTIERPAPTSVQTSAPKLSASDTAALKHAKNEFYRLEKLLADVSNLKFSLAEIGEQFAAGKVDLLTAASVICSSLDQRHEMMQALRTPLKQAQKQAMASAKSIVEKTRKHACDELAEKCRVMENGERENALTIGIGADDYRPSGMLESLREQYRRAIKTITEPVSLSDL